MTTRVIATAGHVDHGKSTLVRALTGTDPDRLAEEKRRGLTIELGFAHLATGAGDDLHFVDVPGHTRFIKTMLAGVGAIDACLFVVAATEGWKPQSEEHLRILELLGITAGVVAITMADRVDADLVELARLEVAEHTEGTFLEHAPTVVVDSLSGHGLDELRAALEELGGSPLPARSEGRPRLWIDRSFAMAGAGTIVTGTLTGGSLAIDEIVELHTERALLSARIRGLQAFHAPLERVEPGGRVAVNLSGVGHRALGRGDALVTPGRWHSTARVDASLRALPSSPNPIRNGGAHLAYIGSGEHAVRLRILGSSQIAAGESGWVRITLPRSLPLLPGDRFVLRDSGSATTVAGGVILDVDPLLPPSRAHPDRSVERVVAERGWVEVELLERLTGVVVAPTVGRWVVAPAALEAAHEDLVERVHAAGADGLDVALLDDQQRAIVQQDRSVSVEAGRVVPAASTDLYASHPFLLALQEAPYQPPAASETGTSPREVAELVRRGLAVREDGLVFAVGAVEGAAAAAARLLSKQPHGFTMSELRTELQTTRRFAMALVAILDRDGITRRRGDLRIGGPRLPAAPAPGAQGRDAEEGRSRSSDPPLPADRSL